MAKLLLKESMGTNLLVSFLIRHPELSSLRYNPQTAALSFTILLTGEVPAERQSEFLVHMETYFGACKDVDPRFPALGVITHSLMEGVTVLVYEQKVDVVKLMEIRLFVQVVSDFYRGMISDDLPPLQEEEVDAQEEIIEQILGQKDAWRGEKSLVAYRDGGKVFVYNK